MTELVTVKTRWRHQDGRVIDCFEHEVPLRRAVILAEDWRAKAEEAHRDGNLRIAQVYQRDADALSFPASLAYEERKRRGCRTPLDEQSWRLVRELFA